MLSQQFSAVYHNATTTWGVSPFHFLASQLDWALNTLYQKHVWGVLAIDSYVAREWPREMGGPCRDWHLDTSSEAMDHLDRMER